MTGSAASGSVVRPVRSSFFHLSVVQPHLAQLSDQLSVYRRRIPASCLVTRVYKPVYKTLGPPRCSWNSRVAEIPDPRVSVRLSRLRSSTALTTRWSPSCPSDGPSDGLCLSVRLTDRAQTPPNVGLGTAPSGRMGRQVISTPRPISRERWAPVRQRGDGAETSRASGGDGRGGGTELRCI